MEVERENVQMETLSWNYTSMFLAAISVQASSLVLYNIFCLFISSSLVLCTFVSCFNVDLGLIHFVICLQCFDAQRVCTFLNKLNFLASHCIEFEALLHTLCYLSFAVPSGETDASGDVLDIDLLM